MFITQLQYFTVLAMEKNYLAAATKLHITQPALSDAIQELEQELGVPLFTRKGDSIELTLCGSEFRNYTVRALSELGKGIELVHERTAQLACDIKIGTSDVISDRYLSTLFDDYINNVTSSVNFDLYRGFEAPLLDGLKKELYDVVFVANPQIEDPALSYTKMTPRNLSLCVSPGHPFVKQSSISCTQLRNSRIVTYGHDSTLAREANLALASSQLSAQHFCEDSQQIVQSVLRDTTLVGLLIFPIEPQVTCDSIMFRFDKTDFDLGSIYLVCRKQDRSCSSIESFINHAKAYMGAHLDKVA